MRVLHVIPSVGPVRGGPSQAVLELVKTLNEQGVGAEIAATNDNGPGLLDVPLGQRTEFAGAPVWFFPRFSPRVRAIREFAYSRALTVWLEANVERYDLIHVHAFFSHASTMAMRIARRKKMPFIVRPLGLLCSWSMQQSAFRKNAYLTLFERRSLNACSGLEYTAEQEMNDSAPVGLTAPSFVLPFGLHMPQEIGDARARLRQQIRAPQDEPVLLFLSRLHPKKGLDVLLDSLETLANRRFSLVIAGSGSPDYESMIKMRAAAGPLKDRVHFVGFAHGEFKQMLLQGSDVFALTSHSESFAIAVLEAMAAGIPAVVTPGVPLASLVQKFGLGWVAEMDRDSIAAQVQLALNELQDVEAAQARRVRARALVANNFTWNQIARRMEAVYEAVLRRDPLPSFGLERVRLPAAEHKTGGQQARNS